MSDASAVADALKEDQGFEVWSYHGDRATGAELRRLFEHALPSVLRPNDRLLIYFAVHAVIWKSPGGATGYLLPADAQHGDPSTFFAMAEIIELILRLDCHHLLLVLDCCFSGTMQQPDNWDAAMVAAERRWRTRDPTYEAAPPLGPPRAHREPFESFVEAPAWQMLTSGARDQLVLDTVSPARGRAQAAHHSPFARAFLRGLRGDADYTRKGLVTTQELAVYLRDRVEKLVRRVGWCQSPQVGHLQKHGGGEFVFKVPVRVRSPRSSRPPPAAANCQSRVEIPKRDSPITLLGGDDTPSAGWLDPIDATG